MLAAGRVSGEFAAYAYRCAVNAVRSFLRRERRRGFARCPAAARVAVANEAANGEGVALADLAACPETHGHVEWAADRWRRVLGCLPRFHRRVVLVRVVEGKTFEAIAADLGCSDTTAKAAWDQSLATLRAAHPELAGEVSP